MGYYRVTRVSCTSPDLFVSGSTFNQEWSDCIVSIKNGVVEYYCRKDYLNDALIELSKQHPEVTFSAVTWNDSDYYDRIIYSIIIKNGVYEVVNREPEYQYFSPVIDNDEYNKLSRKFKDHVDIYLKRIDIIRKDPIKGTIFDFLNDNEDNDGFRSYYTIVWENHGHKFIATKRFTSHVIVEYQKKNPDNDKLFDFEKDQLKDDQDESNDLPF